MKTNIVENYILEKIQNGSFTSKIETEDQLSEQLRVSKITVRNAISNLVNQGVLRKIQGSGVFVAPSDDEKIYLNMDLVGFRERASLESKTASSLILILKKIATPSSMLNSIPCKTIWYYERVNFFDEQPMAYEEGHIRADLFSQLTNQELEISKYQYFSKQQQSPYKVEKIFLPMVATPKISKLLKLQGKPPLIVVKSVVYSQNTDLLDITTAYYNPDKFSVRSSSIIK